MCVKREKTTKIKQAVAKARLALCEAGWWARSLLRPLSIQPSATPPGVRRSGFLGNVNNLLLRSGAALAEFSLSSRETAGSPSRAFLA